MTELWIKKSTTDVHRKIDNKLPPGSICSAVTMESLDDGATEEYTAIVNGEEVIVELPADASADEVADQIVASAPEPPPPAEPATTENAQLEGAEITEADEAMGGPVPEEYEYDDSTDDDEGWETDTEKPKSKTKSKSKKK